MDSVHHEDESVVMQLDDSGIADSIVNDGAAQHTIPEAGIKRSVKSEGPWNKDIWNRDIGSNNNRDQLGSRQQEEGRSHNSER